MRRIILCVFAGVLMAAPAGAQSVAPASSEFVALFSDLCLQKFPDDAGMAALAGGKGQVLTPAEVKLFLHDDPGQGWVLNGQDSKYVLTDEHPPYHACAVRRTTPQVLDGGPLFAAALAYVTGQGEKLSPPQQTRFPGALPSLATVENTLDKNGQPTGEAFMYFVVSYPSVTRQDGSKSEPFFDVRFVRQIYRKAV